jgi:hypothetical protein
VDSLNLPVAEDIYQVNNIDVCNSPQDYNLLRSFFALVFLHEMFDVE